MKHELVQIVRIGAAAALLTAAVTAQASIQRLGDSLPRASGVSPDGGVIAGYQSNQTHYWATSNQVWTSTLDGTGTEAKVANLGAFISANVNDVNNSNFSTAARWQASTGAWTPLPGLGGVSGSSVSTAYDISADGNTVVGLAWINAGSAHAFKWTPTGGTVDMGLWMPGLGWSSRANGVSADGNFAAGLQTSPQRAIRWNLTNGTGVFLGSLDPAQPVSGASTAYGLSADGTYVCGTSNNRAFLWSAAQGMRDLGAIGTPGFGNSGYGLAVSAGGDTVVGWSGANFINSKALIWRRGMTQCEDLRDYLNNTLGVFAAYTDWNELKIATDISSDGAVVVGWGVNFLGATESFRVTLPPVPPLIANYCTAGTTTLGCSPSMAASGNPSATAASGFTLSCTGVEGQKTGLVFYGTSGRVALPWATGSTSYLCVQPPTQRTVLQNAGGTLGLCNGGFNIDFLAFMAANPAALGQPLTPGQVINTQTWFRDPPAPKTTNLSDAIEFLIAP